MEDKNDKITEEVINEVTKNYNVTEQGGMDSDTKDVNSEVINIS